MDNRQDQRDKPREIIYQVGRKKGKIVLGNTGKQSNTKAIAVEQIPESIVVRTLFHPAIAPNAKAVVVLYVLLPIAVFVLTILLLVILIQT